MALEPYFFLGKSVENEVIHRQNDGGLRFAGFLFFCYT